MKATLVTLEQSFDPGFTVRLYADTSSAHFVIVDKAGKIVERHIPQPWEQEKICRDVSHLIFLRVREYFTKLGHAYQTHVGWRDAA